MKSLKMKYKDFACETCDGAFKVYERDHRILSGCKIRFCSSACIPKDPNNYKEIKCANCREAFSNLKSRTQRKFCTRRCSDIGRRVLNPKWENKEYVVKYQKEYQIKNRDRVNELSRIRNKTKKGRIAKAVDRIARRGSGKLSKEQYINIIERSKGLCFWCSKLIESKIHLDHVLPVCLGGKTTVDNLVVSCRMCNQSKGGKHPLVFLESLGRKAYNYK